MADFRFYHPVEVRYADIDAQRHVNNVVFFTYMETARAAYLRHLGLWDAALGRDEDVLPLAEGAGNPHAH